MADLGRVAYGRDEAPEIKQKPTVPTNKDVWVKIAPPGIGPQVLVFGSILPGQAILGTPIFLTHSQVKGRAKGAGRGKMILKFNVRGRARGAAIKGSFTSCWHVVCFFLSFFVLFIFRGLHKTVSFLQPYQGL